MAEFADGIVSLPLVQALRGSARRDGISESDVDQLYGLVLRVADTAGPLLSRIPETFTQYTEHDIRHARNLIDLCGRIIPTTTLARLNAIELALLILGILLHDFGMFVSTDEKHAALASEEFARFLSADPTRVSAIETAQALGRHWEGEYLRDAALAEFFRRVHPERAAENIARYIEVPLSFRDVDLHRAVATLAESHGWGVPSSLTPKRPEKAVAALRTNQPIYGFPVNVQYLACCLRLADVMDFDRSRTPLAVFKAAALTEKRSLDEWHKHLQIVGWSVTPAEAAYAAVCEDPALYVAVNRFLDLVDAEIQACKALVLQAPAKIAARYELQLAPLVDRSRIEMQDRTCLAGGYQFELDYERIMAILMDKSLYGDPSLFLRELLQNAADACRLAGALAAEASTPYRAQIVVEVRDVSGQHHVVVRDNGIGMSLDVLLNYFLRVGRSFYRSQEFVSTRQRLAGMGIGLEATSQFGIGILSCFMVAERLEVRTHRRGHRPLLATVEGPTRYFVIHQLDEPARHDFAGVGADAGTQITVVVERGKEVDVDAAIKAVAVNLDYDIAVVSSTGDERTIAANGWEAPPSTEDADVDYISLLDGPEWELRSRPRHTAEVSVGDVLAASWFRFSEMPVSQPFRGVAWLWLLRGADGSPTPAEGYLEIGEDLHLRGVPATLGALWEQTRARHGTHRQELQRVGEVLCDSVGRGTLPSEVSTSLHALYAEAERDDQDPDDLTEELAETWSEMDEDGRSRLAASLRALKSEPVNWTKAPGLVAQLREGLGGWEESAIEFSDKVRMGMSVQQHAMYGMLMPSGILRWDPQAGFARKVSILGSPGGLRLDYRGPGAPRPAVSRLFVEAFDATSAAVAALRAVVQHAAALAIRGATRPWYRWFRGLISRTTSLPYWRTAILQELSLIERLPVYSFRDTYVTGAELRGSVGRWAVVKPLSSRERFLWELQGANGVLLSCRPRRSVGDVEEVDLDLTLPPAAEVFPSRRFWA